LNEAAIVLIIWLICITAIWIYVTKRVYRKLKQTKKHAKASRQLYQELLEIQKAYEKTMAMLVDLFVPRDVIEASLEPLAQKIENAVKKIETEISEKPSKPKKKRVTK